MNNNSLDKKILNLFIIMGAVIPYIFLALFIRQHGIDVPLLAQQVFGSLGATFFALDVIVAALFVVYLAARNQALGRKRYVVIGVALCVGPSCALPLYYRLT